LTRRTDHCPSTRSKSSSAQTPSRKSQWNRCIEDASISYTPMASSVAAQYSPLCRCAQHASAQLSASFRAREPSLSDRTPTWSSMTSLSRHNFGNTQHTNNDYNGFEALRLKASIRCHVRGKCRCVTDSLSASLPRRMIRRKPSITHKAHLMRLTHKPQSICSRNCAPSPQMTTAHSVSHGHHVLKARACSNPS